MKYLNNLVIVVTFLALCSCSNDDALPPVEPSAVDLLFPDNNQVCQEGEIINSNVITIPFEWSTDEKATSYGLEITSITSPEMRKLIPTTDTKATVELSPGTQYKWKVVSINGSETAASEIWNFYTQGEAITNHVPFPAEITVQDNGNSTVDLSWDAVDLDGDISYYNIYLLDKNPPTLYKEKVTVTSIKAIPLISGKQYYLEIDVIDSTGNKAKSKTSFMVK
ncbi:fibronectin type III domain-containing protein [Aquimarina spinulae]|uniref:fibronectin type III domain-containing protein n=2 Tax=Aquimarina spinulae TaxID=1192023 RepID=UPI0010488BD8|nr:fibronectin type III domain-containing protein [Aquimarina spinulae]